MIGRLSSDLLDVLLETLPVEFSIVDHNDKVIAWNRHGSRLFKRPENVLGRDVRDCHPKASLDKVEQLLEEMKSGQREMARFWIDIKSESGPVQKILIDYYALRGSGGQYLGCLEVTRNISEIQSLKGEKRLLD